MISSLPDPDTNTEVGQSHEEHDDVCDEEDVLESLKHPMGRLHFCIAHWTVAHPLNYFKIWKVNKLVTQYIQRW